MQTEDEAKTANSTDLGEIISVSSGEVTKEQTEKNNDEEMEVQNENLEEEKTESLPLKKKRKKSKKIKRSQDYPKYYQNAYVRYCNETRPKICVENPEMDSVEITKLVASKWFNLPKEEKQPYIDLANKDKERFEHELEAYKLLNPDEENDKEKVSKKKKKKRNIQAVEIEQALNSVPVPATNIPGTSHDQITNNIPIPSTSFTNNSKEDHFPRNLGTNYDLPIFTDAFLEHNKTIEAELKSLRKNNIEMEQQNSVLLKHIENMENGVTKVDAEIAANKKKNMHLEVYLTKLRCKLSANFNSLPLLPGWKNNATVENIDKYINDLSSETLKSSPSTTVNKARDILKKLDLKIT